MTKKKVKGKFNLDVGCGENCQPGFVGMDVRKVKGVEIVHDAEKFPWPVESGSCSVVIMSHFVEHIKPWLTIKLMDECWRVLKPDGLLMVSTPYAGSFRYHQDPTHCNPWNEATVEYFLQNTPLYSVYKPKPWRPEMAPNGQPQVFWAVDGDLEIALRKVK